MTENQDLVAKIRWQCRRGMLELDYILNHFLASGLTDFDTDELNSLQQFLDNQDPDLFAWFMGYDKPTEDNDIHWLKEILTRQPDT